MGRLQDTSNQKAHPESEGVEKIFYANRNKKKAKAAILLSDKIDCKTKQKKS